MKTFILYILLLCCAVLTACEHKDLCYNHPHDKELRIRFDWSAIDKKAHSQCGESDLFPFVDGRKE